LNKHNYIFIYTIVVCHHTYSNSVEDAFIKASNYLHACDG